MSNLIFESWHSWQVCFLSGVKKLCWGFGRIVTCIILGVVSVVVWLWRMACKFVGNYPNVALGTFIVIAAVVWLLTFVSMKSRAIGAEHQRDSIAWQYHNFKTTHGYE